MSKKKILSFGLFLFLAGVLIFLYSQEYENSLKIKNKISARDLADKQITKSVVPQNSTDGHDKQPEQITNQQPDGRQSVSRVQNIEDGISLDIPFTAQAPYAVWDNLHNEACEEVALIMAKYWLTGKNLTPQKAEQEIQAAVKWQEEHWGGHYDLPVEKIVELGQQYFNLKKIGVLSNPTIDDIKEGSANGHLIIVPTAGRLLKNPYYRQPGPVYHMLVVTGYDGKHVITNDPGTRRGENFKYTYQNFFEAIHDWPYGPPDYGQGLSKDALARGILGGRRTAVVVEK
jgi:hypothetical protein